MSRLIDLHTILATVFLAVALPTLPLIAAPFDVPDEVAESLLAELEENYEVLVLRRGYVLQPRGDADFEIIEIEEGSVAVDGEIRDLDQLRELVGDDAEVIFALTGDLSVLDGLDELQNRLEEVQLEAAAALEASIRQQVEELERLDRDRLEDLDRRLDRDRRRNDYVRTEARVSLGSSLTIKEKESAAQAVAIFGPLNVRGEVRSDAVAVLSSAEVTGRVDGNLTVVGGNLSIGPEAEIDGDIVCVGGVVDQAPGAEIHGEISEISLGPLMNVDLPGFDFEMWRPFDWGHGFKMFEFVGTIFSTALLTILVLITLLVARERISSVAERARREPWKSGLVGFVIEVLILPILMVVSLLLVISIVGIPVLMVLLPLTFLVLVVLFIMGYAGVAVALGQSTKRFDTRRISPFVAVLIGIVLIQIWEIFGEGLTFAGGLIYFAGIMMVALGFFIKYLAWTVGLGAVMLDRFSPLPANAPYVPPLPGELPADVESSAGDEDFPEARDEPSSEDTDPTEDDRADGDPNQDKDSQDTDSQDTDSQDTDSQDKDRRDEDSLYRDAG